MRVLIGVMVLAILFLGALAYHQSVALKEQQAALKIASTLVQQLSLTISARSAPESLQLQSNTPCSPRP